MATAVCFTGEPGGPGFFGRSRTPSGMLRFLQIRPQSWFRAA